MRTTRNAFMTGFALTTIILSLAALPGCGRRQSQQAEFVPKLPPTEVYWNKEPLAPNAFSPLPLGSVKPLGWLRRQLEIQASGLTGNLEEVWPDVGPNSGWLGGTGESWERAPYYLDGLVPIALLLEDEKLIARAKKWVDWTLENQQPEGRIGAILGRGQYRTVHQESDTWWPNMIMLKVLTQWQEATGDPRVMPVMEKYFAHHLRQAAEHPLREWAAHRWADQVLSLVWLYNRTGKPELLDLARVLHKQSFDWNAHFAKFQYPGKVRRDQAKLHTHVVNNAMAMKTSAVWSQVSGDDSDRKTIYQLLEHMDRYHGQPNGVHSGDEHYAGLDPSQGTELCAVVEGMFSLGQLVAILGDPAFGDRLERVTFNALPATFKKDMWAHQYDQQVNQVMCSVLPNRNWTTNGPESNIFGLEPNFGCCTANMHQGWPKFAAHLWMATREGGLAAVAYAPSRVDAKVRGVEVVVAEDTEYPFRDRVNLKVYPTKPVTFPLVLRVPSWAEGATITVQGAAQPNVKPGTFHTVEREWKSGDSVELVFPKSLRVTRHYRDGIVVNRGPLVFSLVVGEDWKLINRQPPAGDWEVHPTTPWNYGLVIDPAEPDKYLKVEERPLGSTPFSPEGAPVRIAAKGRRIPDWKLVAGSAGPLPQSPVRTREPEEDLTLIPYGCTNLRVTVFPHIVPEASQRQARAAPSGNR